MEYVTSTKVRAFPADTWDECDFRERSFGYEAGCVGRNSGGAGSGACHLLTRVEIVSIELVEAESA